MHEFQTPEAIQAWLSLLVANVSVDATERQTTTVEVQPTDPGNPHDVEMVQRTKVSFDDGSLTIRSPRSALWLPSRPRGSIEVAVQVPAGSSVHAETATGALRTTGTLDVCRLDTAAGDVAIERSRTLRVNKAAGSVTIGEVTGDARIESASGEIEVGRIGGGAKIDTASGEVIVGSVDGDLTISGANGNIVIERCGASVKANTAFGTVRLLAVVQGKVKADSARGDIEIGIAEGTAAWLDLNTTFGHAHSELGEAHSPQGDERTVEVRASTAFGDITVRRAQPSAGGMLAITEA
jgi:putative adhesin